MAAAGSGATLSLPLQGWKLQLPRAPVSRRLPAAEQEWGRELGVSCCCRGKAGSRHCQLLPCPGCGSASPHPLTRPSTHGYGSLSHPTVCQRTPAITALTSFPRSPLSLQHRGQAALLMSGGSVPGVPAELGRSILWGLHRSQGSHVVVSNSPSVESQHRRTTARPRDLPICCTFQTRFSESQ